MIKIPKKKEKIKMHNVKILALLLICTLAISMGSTLGIARGLIIKPPTPLPTSPFTSQESADEAQAKQLIDQSFIDMFGLQSDLTAVTSDVNFCNTTSQEAYTYNATFVPSQGSSYAVELSYNQTAAGNLEMTVSQENITGALNLFYLNEASQTFIENTVVKTDHLLVEYNDSSDVSHEFVSDSQIFSTSNETDILNATETGYQSIDDKINSSNRFPQ